MGMGDLDDAIREHLELKRRHGASDEEVTIKEREAQRQGALPSDPGAPPPDPEPVPSERTPADAEVSEETAAASTEPSAPLVDELDPDEVLPEEALEVAPVPEVEDSAAPAPDWSRDVSDDTPEPEEDLLEETPEFLEDMPEQDRLWFEQRPPKDFDFGD
jgi:hypothetical protein